ncbi:hypothetical protein [Pseudomonas sp. FSL W7-0098]|uniref:hypothetical protein n=1 Tax=Pseudomonas sp. FSL W7-0098 TaxID=2496120 RepID=UPI00110CE6EE|nr:hypothetical protein [Pseudomonas sp. FSL W7-0098]
MLQEKGVSYIHVVDVNGWFGAPDVDKILEILAGNFTGALTANAGLDLEKAAALVKDSGVTSSPILNLLNA